MLTQLYYYIENWTESYNPRFEWAKMSLIITSGESTCITCIYIYFLSLIIVLVYCIILSKFKLYSGYYLWLQ